MQKVGIKSSGWTNEIYIYMLETTRSDHQLCTTWHHVFPVGSARIGPARTFWWNAAKSSATFLDIFGRHSAMLWMAGSMGFPFATTLRMIFTTYITYIYNMILIHWTINISKENWKQILSILPFRINISTSMLSNPSSLCTASCLLALGRSHLIRTPECRATPPAARLGFSARWNDCYDGV